jgi:hypothetical protein
MEKGQTLADYDRERRIRCAETPAFEKGVFARLNILRDTHGITREEIDRIVEKLPTSREETSEEDINKFLTMIETGARIKDMAKELTPKQGGILWKYLDCEEAYALAKFEKENRDEKKAKKEEKAAGPEGGRRKRKRRRKRTKKKRRKRNLKKGTKRRRRKRRKKN